MKRIFTILLLLASYFAVAQNPAGGGHRNLNFIIGRLKLDSMLTGITDTTNYKVLVLHLPDSLVAWANWMGSGGGGGGGTPGGNSKDVQIKSGGNFYGSDNFVLDTVNFRVGIGTATPLSKLYLLNSGIGTTFNINQGIYLANKTTGTQQNSPPIVLEGNVDFGGGSSDSTFRYSLYVAPLSSSTVALGNLIIQPATNGVNKQAIYIDGNASLGVHTDGSPNRSFEVRDSTGTNQIRFSTALNNYAEIGVGTTGKINIFSSGGAFVNEFDLGSATGNVNVFGNHGTGANYAAFGEQNNGTNGLAIYFGNLSNFSATREAVIYDFVATKPRFGIDVNGTMWLGSSNTVYTLQVQQPNASAIATVQDVISQFGFHGIGVTAPTGQLIVGGTVLYNATGSYGTTGALIGTNPNIRIRDGFTVSGSLSHMVVNGFAQDSMSVQHSAITYTNASTVYIAGPPVPAHNTALDTAVTITNPWSLYVNSGNAGFGGPIMPTSTAAIDIGTASLAWRDVYMGHEIGESTIGGSSALGTNVSSVTPAGNDINFQLTVVTSGNVSGTIAIISFGRTWGATPKCMLTAANTATGLAIQGTAGSYTIINGTSATQATVAGVIVGAGTYIMNCHCGL